MLVRLERETLMAITHLMQLRRRAPEIDDAAAASSHGGEIALGDSLTVISRVNRCSDIAEATFGLDNGKLRDSFEGQVDPAAFSAIDHAVWDTQRCVIPITGFRSAKGAAHKGSRWHPGNGVAYIAALRYSVTDALGRHGEAKILVGADRMGQELPFALDAISPLQWLLLPGKDALEQLDQRWRRN
jgi:hypothetical protein